MEAVLAVGWVEGRVSNGAKFRRRRRHGRWMRRCPRFGIREQTLNDCTSVVGHGTENYANSFQEAEEQVKSKEEFRSVPFPHSFLVVSLSAILYPQSSMGCGRSLPYSAAEASRKNGGGSPLPQSSAPAPMARRSSSNFGITGFAKVKNRSLNPKGVDQSKTKFYERVSQEHCDERGTVRAGRLLQWMDICACLSAERHGGLSSVTLSMDDLTFLMPATVGGILEISAQVNNAFNTSMEVGVTVTSVDAYMNTIVHCRGFFTFVSLDHTGKKCKVPKVIPETEGERDAFILAKERRQMRFKRQQMIDKFLQEALTPKTLEIQREASTQERDRVEEVRSAAGTSAVPWTGQKRRSSLAKRKSERKSKMSFFGSSDTKKGEVIVKPMSSSSLIMTKVVLPSDANHMGNTFGGNVMSWMDDAATVAAIRHCAVSGGEPVQVVTIAVDAMAFLGSSKVGDRITLKAQVNRAFGSTMEVGVRVVAQALGGHERHINTGYLTLMAIGSDGSGESSNSLPRVQPQTPEQELQFEKALGRRALRMQRKKIAGAGSGSNGLAWTYSDEMRSEISLANIYGLLKVANDNELIWHHLDVPKEMQGMYELRLEMNRDTWNLGITTLKVSGLVTCDMKVFFDTVMDMDKRKSWDLAISEGEVVKQIDDHNDVIWMSYKNLTGRTEQNDYSLLRTWKEDEDRYIIASRSIVHPDLVEKDGFVRAQVFPSGFILTPWIMDDGMGDLRDVEFAKHTSFEYVVQLDETGQRMAGMEDPNKEMIFHKLLIGSLVKLCTLLSTTAAS